MRNAPVRFTSSTSSHASSVRRQDDAVARDAGAVDEHVRRPAARVRDRRQRRRSRANRGRRGPRARSPSAVDDALERCGRGATTRAPASRQARAIGEPDARRRRRSSRRCGRSDRWRGARRAPSADAVASVCRRLARRARPRRARSTNWTTCLGRQVDGRAEALGDQPPHRFEAQDAADHRVLGLELHAAHELHRAIDERRHRALHDVGRRRALREVVDHFRLGEHRADARDRRPATSRSTASGPISSVPKPM